MSLWVAWIGDERVEHITIVVVNDIHYAWWKQWGTVVDQKWSVVLIDSKYLACREKMAHSKACLGHDHTLLESGEK